MQRVRQIPRASLAALLAVIAASYLLVWLFNLWFSVDDFARDLALRSHGWINPNLVMFVPMTLLVVGGLALPWGGQRLRDLGLKAGALPPALLLLVVLWASIQLLAALASGSDGSALTWHSAWSEPGAGFVLGFLFAMILGTALFEEAVFRGFLLPQIMLRLPTGASRRARTTLAILISAMIFSFWHLPTLLINQDLGAAGTAIQLLSLAGAGVLLALLYLRTGNLFVTMAVHTLVNAPTLLFSSPVSGSVLAGFLGVGVIVFWPWLHRQPLRAPLLDFERSG